MLEGQKSGRNVSITSVHACPGFRRPQGISSNAGYCGAPLLIGPDAIRSLMTEKIRNQPERFAIGDLPLRPAIFSGCQRAVRPRANGRPV